MAKFLGIKFGARKAVGAAATGPAPFTLFLLRTFLNHRRGKEELPWPIHYLYIIRFLQFVFGLAVVGLYGQDVEQWRRRHETIKPEWLFATTIGGISAIIALLFWTVEIFKVRYLSFIADAILNLCWLVAFSVFASKYLPYQNPTDDKDVLRMYHSVFVLLGNWALWITTNAVMTTFWYTKQYKRKTTRRDVEK